MRSIIIGMILLYRRLIPPHRRRPCLFRETCSLHIERVTREAGGLAAMRALLKRIRCCRPGYAFEFVEESNAWELVCKDGSRFVEAEVAPHIVAEYYTIERQLRS
jgi:hypothetical protein